MAELTVGEIETLLSEKLLDGYVLLETSCPACATPLVRNNHMVPKNLTSDNHGGSRQEPTLVPGGSFDQPFRPVPGVPVCVVCRSHVITQECEISILERCDSLKDKGSILVALNTSTYGDDSQYTDESEEKKEEENPSYVDEEVVYEDYRVAKDHGDDEDMSKAEDGTAQVPLETECRPNFSEEPIFIEEPTTPKIIPWEELPPLASSGEEEIVAVTENGIELEQAPATTPVPVPAPALAPPQTTTAQPEVAVISNSTFDDTTASVVGSKKGCPDGVEGVMEEYSVRRDVATKVLGAKMLLGYSLLETTCDRCGMPQMEKGGKLVEDCFVCIALTKYAKKKFKAQQRLDEEKARLERDIEAKKTAERKTREEQLEKERLEREQYENTERSRRAFEEERSREEEGRRLLIVQRQRKMEEERAMLLAIKAEEEYRIAYYEAEEARSMEESRNRAMAAALEQKLESQARKAKQQQEERMVLEIQKETEQRLAAGRQMQKAEEEALFEEARTIEAYETNSLASTTKAMTKDLLEQEHRRRLIGKMLLDEEISQLEEIRHTEELDLRQMAEERRAEEEGRMIATLEADAASKALAAEDAIRKAKSALEYVHSTKREIIAQTIAMAEKEAIAETEEFLKAELEDHKEAIILPSESQLHKERWETLRMEGRAIMTRRVLQGWQLIPQTCEGVECHMSPLITKLGRTECVVCGGTGSGCDGVYSSEQDNFEMFHLGLDPTLLPPQEIMTPYHKEDDNDDILTYGNQEEFEEKRNVVSKEIGKRMLWGWVLLDASCPKCVMPLMMDDKGNSNICVLHGQVEPYVNASIKAKETQSIADVEEQQDVGNVFLDEKRDEKNEEMTAEETIFEDTAEASQPEPQQQREAAASLPQELNIPKEDNDLFKTIRDRASRQQTTPPTPRGDPPAFTKGLSTTIYQQRGEVPAKESFEETDSENGMSKTEDPIYQADRLEPARPSSDDNIIKARSGKIDPSESRSEDEEDDDDDESIIITIPKNFDFADPEAVKQLMKVAAGEDIDCDDQPDEEEEEGKDALSPELVSNMFLSSPQGYGFSDLGGNMTLTDIKDLVDIFMVTNFDETVTDDFKLGVAQDIIEKLHPDVVEPEVIPTAAIIRLELMPSPDDNGRDDAPRAFHFDDYPDMQSTRSSGPRNRPSPEMMSSPRYGSRSVNAARPPMSPQKMPPRSGGTRSKPIVVGGPLSAGHRSHSGGQSHHHGGKSISEGSRASSVASDALESIYARIDQCKVKLMDPTNTIDDQLAAADLIEKLAKAALAVRAMEKLEAYE